jgi:integrase
MAKLYRHKRRGWQVHYTVYFPDGTDKRKFRHFRNKLMAQDALRDVEKLEYRSLKDVLLREDLLLYARLKYVSQEESDKLFGKAVYIPTLGELATEFLEKSRIEVRSTVFPMHKYRIGHLLRYFGDDVRIINLTTERIEEYRRHRLESVRPITINKEITKLAQILDIAVSRKAISENPARELKKLRDRRERKPRALTREEIAKLKEVAKRETQLMLGFTYPIIMIYLYTGMRRNELLFLEWQDIDFERRIIMIQSKEGGEFATKTGLARTVGLSKTLAEVLKSLPPNGRFVFGGDHPLMRGDSLSWSFRKLARKAGLPDSINIHSLRHTYITHLMEKGVNPRRVQELAGHLTFGTTWGYSHVLPSNEIVEDLLDF